MKKILTFIIVAVCAATRLSAQKVAKDPIVIVYDGATATVTVPPSITDVTYDVQDANVSIYSETTNTEYTYRVSGTSSTGSLYISGSYKLTLELAGLNLTNPNGGAAIDVECGKRTDLVLVEGTINTLMDSEYGAQKGALHFKGHADFKGGGTLNVTGKLGHAIDAKEEIELKSSLGIINVLGAVKDGIHCGRGKIDTPEHNYFEMDGGTVNITNVGSDGIDADDFGYITINGGALSVNVNGENSDGIKADYDMEINGGDINVFIGGLAKNSEGISTNQKMTINDGNIQIYVVSDGSKGIKAKKVSEDDSNDQGGCLEINGGNIEIYVSGEPYLKEDNSTSNCIGISVDDAMNQTGGTITLRAMGQETKAINVKGSNTKTGGTLNVTEGPWLMDNSDYNFDMTCFIRVYKNGQLLTDYSNVAIGAFIGTECMGLAEFDQSEYGYVRVYYDATDDDPVSFKLYDNQTGEEYDLISDREVLFDAQGIAGMPSNPIILNYSTFLLGDVNGDGNVTLADAIMILYRSFGIQQTGFIEQAADVTMDGNISLSDAIEVLYKSFGVNVNWTKSRLNHIDPD